MFRSEIIKNPVTEFDKEQMRWEKPRREGGMRPDGYEPYPKMVYKALLDPEQQKVVVDAEKRGCWLTVNNEAELARARGLGWADSPTDALALYEMEEQALGQAAAETAFHARRMSAQAQAELAAADAETHRHVTDVTKRKA